MPLSFLWAFAMALAMIFASFLNVCVTRLPRRRSIVRPASHCPRCLAPVRAFDNLPLLSWLLLGGRCRACRAPIPIRYLLVELAYPALVAAAIFRYGFTLPALGAAVFCFFALGLFVTDLETMLLPDALILPALALGLVAAAFGCAPQNFASAYVQLSWSTRLAEVTAAALAGLAWALLLLTVRLGYYLARRRHGLGLGDVKLAAMLAVWLGAAGMWVAFLVGIFAAAIAGGTLAAMGRRRQNADAPTTGEGRSWATLRLPLGTFLCAGALFALFFGAQLMAWYLSLYR